MQLAIDTCGLLSGIGSRWLRSSGFEPCTEAAAAPSGEPPEAGSGSAGRPRCSGSEGLNKGRAKNSQTGGSVRLSRGSTGSLLSHIGGGGNEPRSRGDPGSRPVVGPLRQAPPAWMPLIGALPPIVKSEPMSPSAPGASVSSFRHCLPKQAEGATKPAGWHNNVCWERICAQMCRQLCGSVAADPVPRCKLVAVPIACVLVLRGFHTNNNNCFGTVLDSFVLHICSPEAAGARRVAPHAAATRPQRYSFWYRSHQQVDFAVCLDFDRFSCCPIRVSSAG